MYAKRYLKEKIVQKYGSQVYFTSQKRRKDVLCRAVNLIKNDISLPVMNKFYYPFLLQMTDLEHQLSILPESLKMFLFPFVKTEKLVAAIGQSIIKTSRPRSGVLPYTLRFALQLDHRFSSKWLIVELHNLGLCESYNEVGNYKYCYLRNKLNVENEIFTPNCRRERE